MITAQSPKSEHGVGVGDRLRADANDLVTPRPHTVPMTGKATAFRYDAALRHGLSRARLRAALDAGRLVRLARGVYAAERDRIEEIAAAFLRIGGDAVVSHETAAELWGIPVLGRLPSTVQLTRPRRRTGVDHFRGVDLRHASVPADHRTLRHGIPVTTPARTVMDLARSRPFRAGVSSADGALRRRLCTREDLLAVAAECRRWPGVQRARQVARFADPRAANPLESISRVAFHEWGLPPPVLQAEVLSLDIVDFLWPEYAVVGEADGMGKYVDVDALRQEKYRQERLSGDGLEVVRWTWREAYHRPDAVAYRVERTLRRRGWRG